MPTSLILLLLLPIALFAWRKFEYAVLLILFLLPTYLLRTSIFNIPTTYLELSIYTVAIVTLGRGEYKVLKTIFNEYKSWVLLAIVFLITTVIGIVIAPDLRLALGIFKGFIIDPFILVILVIIAGYKTDAFLWWQKIITALLLSGAVTVVVALVWDWQRHLARLTGWYDSPNVLAMYLVPILLTGTFWLIHKSELINQNLYLKKIWLWAVVILWIGVWRTGSYGAWLAILICGVYYLANRIPKFVSSLRVVIILGVIGLGILLPFSNGLLSNWGLQGHTNNLYQVTSIQVREVLWQQAVHFIKANPVLGLGLGGWQTLFMREVMPILPAGRTPGIGVELYYASLFPHNLSITLWLYFGLIGMLTIIGSSLMILWKSRKVLGVILLPSIILLSILGQGLLDTPVLKNDLFVIFLLSIVGSIQVLYLSKSKSLE